MSGNEERARGIASKSKQRATLFDVLSDKEAAARGFKKPREESPPPPKRAEAAREPTKAPPPPEPEQAPPPPEPVVLPPRRAEPPPEAVSRTDGEEAAPPMIELDDDRIRVTLTSVGCAFVVFVFALSVLVGFAIGRDRGWNAGLSAGFEQGRASYTAEVSNEIELARSRPPETEPVAGLFDQPPPPDPAPRDEAADTGYDAQTPSGWISGYTYIVAQEFLAGHEDDAREAQAYLAEHGIETELITTGRGTTQLITTQGFNRDDPTQRQLADQLLATLHEVGASYYEAGGGYRLEGYFKKRTGESW